jgi:hypothetical protein
MKPLFYALTIACLATTLAVLPACDDDDDPMTPGGPTTGSVSGTVTFTGTWPSVGDVQVSIYSSIVSPPGVPGGPPDGFTEPLNSATDYPTYNYTLEGLDPGDYAAIFVGWRDPADPPGAKLIGVYWVYVDSLGIAGSGLPKAPGPATVSIDAGDNLTDLDIVADLDLAP